MTTPLKYKCGRIEFRLEGEFVRVVCGPAWFHLDRTGVPDDVRAIQGAHGYLQLLISDPHRWLSLSFEDAIEQGVIDSLTENMARAINFVFVNGRDKIEEWLDDCLVEDPS